MFSDANQQLDIIKFMLLRIVKKSKREKEIKKLTKSYIKDTMKQMKKDLNLRTNQEQYDFDEAIGGVLRFLKRMQHDYEENGVRIAFETIVLLERDLIKYDLLKEKKVPM